MKNVVIFSDNIVKGLKMKQFNLHIHGGKVYLKAFPGAKIDQLNHHIKPSLGEYKYDAVMIHIGINNVLRSKTESEVNDISKKVIITITDNCRIYNIAKTFISSIIRCRSRTTVDIDYINGEISESCIQNNCEFISNMQINKPDLWRDGIQLQESGKIIIAKNIINSINNFLSKQQSKGPGVHHSA